MMKVAKVAQDPLTLGARPDDAQPALEPSSEIPNAVKDHREERRGHGAGAGDDLAAELQRDLEVQRKGLQDAHGLLRQQATIVRLGLEALASHDLDGTLDLLVREAAAVLGVDLCSVQELGPDRATLIRRAGYGYPPTIDGSPQVCVVGEGQATYTLHAATPVVSTDLRSETRFSVPAKGLASGVRSSMSVIVHGKQQAWGVVGVHAKTVRTFTEADTIFLQAIANLMALAIERERVEVALRNRNRQQEAVAVLGRRALVGPHMDDLFADAAREIASTLEVELCEVLQRSPDGRTLVLRAGVGWQPGLVGTARVASGPTSQGGFTMNAEAPVVIADLREETRFEASPLLQDQGVVSGIGVLVPTRNGSFGVLGAHTLSRRVFTQDDSNFLQSVANLLAGAIERHRVEGELRRHRDDLEGLVEERTTLLAASNRELEAFSYTLSHDLRAPLRSINGLSKILQRKHGDTLPEAAKTILGQMSDETIRMGKLIESILALSRLGSVEVTPGAVDVSTLATVALQSLQANDPARDVAWTVEPGLHVVGDDALLRVVVDNLVGNAWKFTARTEGARITVAGEPGGFRVEDNGAGFDMAHARELFQPFHRLHMAEQFEGTGIGLATVNRIVTRHSGRVWAQAAPGKGATFHVALPPAPLPKPSGSPHGHGHGPSHPGSVNPVTAADLLL